MDKLFRGLFDKVKKKVCEKRFEIGELVWYKGKKWEIADHLKGTYALWSSDHAQEVDGWIPEDQLSKTNESTNEKLTFYVVDGKITHHQPDPREKKPYKEVKADSSYQAKLIAKHMGWIKEQVAEYPGHNEQTCPECKYVGQMIEIDGKGKCPKCGWEYSVCGCKQCKEAVVEDKAKSKREIPPQWASATYRDTEEDAIKALNALTDNEGVEKQWAVPDPQADRVWMVFTKYTDQKYSNGDLPGWEAEVVYLSAHDGEIDFETADNTKMMFQKYAPYDVKELALEKDPRVGHWEGQEWIKGESVGEASAADVAAVGFQLAQMIAKNKNKRAKKPKNESDKEDEYKNEYEQITKDYSYGKLGFQEMSDKIKELNKKHGVKEDQEGAFGHSHLLLPPTASEQPKDLLGRLKNV